MKNLLKIIFSLSFIIWSIGNVSSQTPGINLTTIGAINLNSDWSIGWRFSTNVALSISALGVFDEGSDGLSSSHPVGIYSDAGVLLATGTVPAGTGGTLNGAFRYVSIAPVILQPGTYRVVALHLLTGGDTYAFNSTGTFHPNVTWISGAYSNSATLVFPTTLLGSGTSWFGGNFIAGPLEGVPTLGEWGLITFSMLLLSVCMVYMLGFRLSLGGFGSVSAGAGIPFDAPTYFKTLVAVLLVTGLCFSMFVNYFGYSLTDADVPGILINSPILAYAIHLWKMSKKN
ncbi:MAG: DUF4082 domain-containing protein [Saprospiraceae bacterium]|nr:DUF4082 domain-containing protein [Saprospiraceae bacterium]